MSKYTDEQYLDAEMYEDRDLDIRCQTRKIVKTRKEHRCAAGDSLGHEHDIPKGSRAVKETAIVEGIWGSCYGCLDCIGKWLNIIGA